MKTFHRLPVFLFVPFYALLPTAFAQKGLNNPDIQAAFKLTLELKLDSATRICDRLAAKDVESEAWAAYLKDYQSFFRYFISEAESTIKPCDVNRSIALNKLDKYPDTSAWGKYLKAEVHLRSCLAHFKQGSYSAGAQALKKSYSLLSENIARFPEFPYHYRSYGAVEAMLGTVPDNYKWVTNMLGLKGDVAAGIKKIEEALNRPATNDFERLFLRETLFLYTFLQINVAHDANTAWQKVEPSTRDASQNLLSCYLRSVTALKSGRNDEALNTLKNVPQSPHNYPFAYLDYLTGLAYLRKLEAPAAREYLSKFLKTFNGTNHLKDTKQKIAWSALLQGNVNAYREEMRQIPLIGTKRLEDDKQAQYEAEKGWLPHISLLKMRLLFDGGYHERALEVSGQVNVASLAASQQAEFYYRRGRVLQMLGRMQEALADYDKTLELGRDLTEYFAASAALQSGYIYRAQGQKDKARKYFEKVSQCKNEEYKDGLRQKAKAALKQLK